MSLDFELRLIFSLFESSFCLFCVFLRLYAHYIEIVYQYYFIAHVLYFTAKYESVIIFMVIVRMLITDTLFFYFSNGRRKG